MCYSKCLLSSRGTIWVAAYCFKRLKKAQVKGTNISSSVEKILQDDMDFVSYRVLANLLLGVVRIYSKKVEYLFHDCNEVLIKIKKFMIDATNNAHIESLRMSITIPDRFELDAFDLDILEDVGGGNIAPKDEITLKDVMWKDEGFGQLSLDKYQCEEFDFCQNTYSADHLMVEDVHHSHLMDNDFEVSPPNSPINMQAGKEKFLKSLFSQEEPVNTDTFFVLTGLPSVPVNLFSQDQQINEQQTVLETAPCENEIHEERIIEKIQLCRISQEETVDIRKFSRKEEEPVVSVEPFNESHKVGEEHIKAKETANSECQMHQEIGVHEARNSLVSMERLQDDKSNKKKCTDHDKSSVAKEKIEKLIEGYAEEHHNKGKLKLQEKVSIEDENFHVIPLESKNLDVTPQTKSPGGSVARPKPGATTPAFKHISTPAARERARFSRKRKCVLDRLIILPNEVLRQSLHDASDLISKRRTFPRTLHSVWRASRISSLPEGFYKSLLPFHSLELQILFAKKKIKISESLEIVKSPENLVESESQTVGRLEHHTTAPKTPPQCSKIISIECQESTKIQKSDNLGPSSPHECIESEQSLKTDEELNLMKECNVRAPSSYESIGREHCLSKDEELNLMNEDINSPETENSELGGWSGRTRKVARYLHGKFLDLRKQREEEVMNFSQALGGLSRKECARLFYEMLVLRTTSCVDVEQNNAYSDISVWNSPKLDQTLGLMVCKNTEM